MKKIAVLSVVAIGLMLLFVGCVQNPPAPPNPPDPDYPIRMTLEQVQEGAFTGGRLVYSQDPMINQLQTGLLIPILDILESWVPAEDGVDYEFQEVSRTYGYLYVNDVNEQTLTIDYLLFDETGGVAEHGENLEIVNSFVLDGARKQMPTSERADFFYRFSYTAVHPTESSDSPELENASLFSFPMEKPSAQQQRQFEEGEVFRSILFRLQESDTEQYSYENGVVCAHYKNLNLVINPSFWGKENWQAFEDRIEIPQAVGGSNVAVGDYLLEGASSTTRRVTAIHELGDVREFQTEKMHLSHALGALELNISGDMAQLVARYGSDEVKQRWGRLLGERLSFNIIDWDDDITLWEEGPLSVVLNPSIQIGADLGLSVTAKWNELSSKGHLYITPQAHLYLLLELLEGDIGGTGEKDINIFTFKDSFEIGPVEVSVEIPFDIVATYQLPEIVLELGGGPWMDAKVGFSYDIGAKLKFKWGFIPYPHTWHHGDGLADFNMGLKVVKPSFSMEDDLSLGFGLQVSPGLKFYECIHTYLAIPFMFENTLKHQNGKYLYSLDFNLRGDLHFAVEIPFLGTKDWTIGSIFNESWNIYRKDPSEIDERDKGSVATGGEIRSSLAVAEDGTIYGTSNDGKLYTMEYTEAEGLVKRGTEYVPNTYSAQHIELTSPLLDKWAFNSISASYLDPANAKYIYNLYVLGNWNETFPQKITSIAMGKNDAGNDIIFVGFIDGQIHCYDNLYGTRYWENTSMKGQVAISGMTVTPTGELVVLATSLQNPSTLLFCLDKDGNRIGPEEVFAGPTGSIPTINAQGQIIFSTGNVLHVFELNSAVGSSARSDTTFTAGGEITTDVVVGKDGLLYFGSEDHKLYCVNTSGQKQWAFDAGSAVTSTPVIGADGNVYVGTTGGIVYAVATYDEEDTHGNVQNHKGDKIWQSPIDPNDHRGPLVGGAAMTDDGVYVVGSTDHHFYAVKTDSGGLADAGWPCYALNNQNTSGFPYIPSTFSVSPHYAMDIVLDKGQDYTFRVTASQGTPPYAYQWMKDDSPIPGANAATFSTGAVDPEDEGHYHVQVSDSTRPYPVVIDTPKAYLEVNSHDLSQKRWSTTGAFHSSPVMDNANVFTVSDAGKLMKLVPDTGALLAQLNVGAVQNSPVLQLGQGGGPSMVFLALDSGTVKAYEITANAFEQQWSYTLPGDAPFLCNMGLQDGTLLVLVPQQGLFALDAGDGDLAWTWEDVSADYNSELAVGDDGTVYLGSSGNQLIALTPPDGRTATATEKWRVSTAGEVSSGIGIGGDGTLFVGDGQDRFYAVDPTGNILWTQNLQDDNDDDFSGFTSSPVIDAEGNVYVARNNGKLYGFSAEGTQLWLFDAGAGITSTPLLGEGGKLYACTMGGTVHAVNTADGSESWKYDSGSYAIHSSPVLQGSVLFFGAYASEDPTTGRFFALNVDSATMDTGAWPKYRGDNQNTANVQ